MTSRISEHVEGAVQGSPLHNIDAEIAFLGDLIADNSLIELTAEYCRPIDFSVQLYGEIYARMLVESASNRAVDAVTLAPFFKLHDGWPRAFSVLSAASLNAGSKKRTRAYMDSITALSSRRKVVAGLTDVMRSVRDLEISKEEIIADADEVIAELSGQVRVRHATAGEYAQLVIDSFGQPIVGVRCGLIDSLDDVLGVLRPGYFVVVGGRPGMGKTGLITSYSIGAGARGHGVLIHSLEMSGDQLTRRMLADMCYTPTGGIPHERIRDGTVKGAELEAVREAKRQLDALPIVISDAPGLTLASFVRQTRQHRRRMEAKGQKLELVIVDYLQLMAPSRKGLSPYEHATEVSKGLKEFAASEGLVVIAVAQLSREVERRNDKRPVPADLRDSGQIEQDADILLFLYREEYYLAQTEPSDKFGAKYETWRTDLEAVRHKIEFLVPKHRHASSGKAMGWFYGEYAAVRGADFFRRGGDRLHG